MTSECKYQLMGIVGPDQEHKLGCYDTTFMAAEDAQYTFKEYDLFRIVKADDCILGTRFYEHEKDSKFEPGEIFWRLPRKIKRNRQARVLNYIYKKLGLSAK